jgi:calcineurin-like phosphoesterase family protein
MNEYIIEHWNQKIGVDDPVYHLGDFSFGEPEVWTSIIERLNGKIHLIRGNHDHHKKLRKLQTLSGKQIHMLGEYHELYVEDEELDTKQLIVMCHYPIESWNKRHHGAWHLHGHCHGTILSPDSQARLDVGVDCCHYKPVSYEEVKMVMTKKVFKPIDHHGTIPAIYNR